jgi:hypothetical protein
VAIPVTEVKEQKQTQYHFKAFFTHDRRNEVVEIPCGVWNYSANPQAFFKLLGIDNSGTTIQNLKVQFTNNSVIIHKGIKNEVKNLRRAINNQNVGIMMSSLDLPHGALQSKIVVQEDESGESDVEEGVERFEVSHGLDDGTFLMIEVETRSFGGPIMIGLIGLLIYRRRLKANAKGSSAFSSQSSSDEVRHEALIEALESSS